MPEWTASATQARAAGAYIDAVVVGLTFAQRGDDGNECQT